MLSRHIHVSSLPGWHDGQPQITDREEAAAPRVNGNICEGGAGPRALLLLLSSLRGAGTGAEAHICFWHALQSDSFPE